MVKIFFKGEQEYSNIESVHQGKNFTIDSIDPSAKKGERETKTVEELMKEYIVLSSAERRTPEQNAKMTTLVKIFEGIHKVDVHEPGPLYLHFRRKPTIIATLQKTWNGLNLDEKKLNEAQNKLMELIGQKKLSSPLQALFQTKAATALVELHEKLKKSSEYHLNANPKLRPASTNPFLEDRYGAENRAQPGSLAPVLDKDQKQIYFNANLVNYSKIPGVKAQASIATQAPMKETLDPFFDMLVQNNSRTFACLANDIEGGKTQKAFAYWKWNGTEKEVATLSDGTKMYIVGEKNLPNGIGKEYTFERRGKDGKKIEPEQDQQYTMLHFETWPDGGVPKEVSSLINFVKQLDELSTKNGGPVAIHCSAGLGRTGVCSSLLAAYRDRDSLSEIANLNGTDRVDAIDKYVQKLILRGRIDRNDEFVETKPQIAFLYEAVNQIIQETHQHIVGG